MAQIEVAAGRLAGVKRPRRRAGEDRATVREPSERGRS